MKLISKTISPSNESFLSQSTPLGFEYSKDMSDITSIKWASYSYIWLF